MNAKSLVVIVALLVAIIVGLLETIKNLEAETKGAKQNMLAVSNALVTAEFYDGLHSNELVNLNAAMTCGDEQFASALARLDPWLSNNLAYCKWTVATNVAAYISRVDATNELAKEEQFRAEIAQLEAQHKVFVDDTRALIDAQKKVIEIDKELQENKRLDAAERQAKAEDVRAAAAEEAAWAAKEQARAMERQAEAAESTERMLEDERRNEQLNSILRTFLH